VQLEHLQVGVSVHWHLRSCRPENSGSVVLSPGNKPVPCPPRRLRKTQKTQTHNFGRSHSRPPGDRTNCWTVWWGKCKIMTTAFAVKPASPGRRSPPYLQDLCSRPSYTSYQFPFPVASVKVNSKLLLAKLLWRLVAGLPFWPTLCAEFIVCGVGQLQLQLLYCLYLGLINCNCRRLFHNFCIFIKLFFQQSCVKTFDCRCGRQPHRSIAAQLYLLSTQFST